MNFPKINNIQNKQNSLYFTVSDINHSLANALRRTILSDIPIVVFETEPYEKSKAIIYTNTSQLTNEIIKQRLSCIPIHIDSVPSIVEVDETNLEIHLEDKSVLLSDLMLEVSVENTTDTLIYITTHDFKIKNVKTNEYLSEKYTTAIFPPNIQTGYYIDFVRLKPKISEELPGEKLHLTSTFSIKCAKDSSMFNVVSTCSYGNTVDPLRMKEELTVKIEEWKKQGLNIEFETKNWKLLDGLRFFKPESFDFVLETIGIYSNEELIIKACDIIKHKLLVLKTQNDANELEILEANITLEHAYDIILVNEDYTLGKMLEYALNVNFFEKEKIMTFCGFKKVHPHDLNSIIRVAYKEKVDLNLIKNNMNYCIGVCIDIYEIISQVFSKK